MKKFDKILKKKNYTKAEVEQILLGTYEGFSDGFGKKISAVVAKSAVAILNAKKEVFEDIEFNNTDNNGIWIGEEKWKILKEKHIGEE